MSPCAAHLRKAARALESVSPVADASLAMIAGARVLELTVPDHKHIPIVVQQLITDHGLRIDPDHSGTRAADVLTVVVR